MNNNEVLLNNLTDNGLIDRMYNDIETIPKLKITTIDKIFYYIKSTKLYAIHKIKKTFGCSHSSYSIVDGKTKQLFDTKWLEKVNTCANCKFVWKEWEGDSSVRNS